MRTPILIACAVAVAAAVGALLTFEPTPAPEPVIAQHDPEEIKAGMAIALTYNTVCQGITPTNESNTIRTLHNVAQGAGLDLNDEATVADISERAMKPLHQVKGYGMSDRQMWCAKLHRTIAKMGAAP